MKIFGIVAEFNPFHNGHKYLIEQIQSKHNPDLIISVLSSSFVQRGDPNIISKWKRAEIACKYGSNIVLELPFVFACQNAEIFGKGALKILNSCGITDLAFGVENNNIDDLIRISKILLSEDKNIKSNIKKSLKEGNSYINSRNKAYLKAGYLSDSDINILSKSNNILAIEYIKAGLNLNPNLNYNPIKRYKSHHDTEDVVEGYTSASNIRKIFIDKGEIDEFVPIETYNQLLKEKIYNNKMLHNIFKFDALESDYNIRNALEYEPGIENRIINFLDNSNSIDELANLVSSKRITKARIRRIIINSLVRVNKNHIFNALNNESYIRILALDSRGRNYLKNLKQDYITNFKEIKKAPTSIQKIAKIEVKASNLYSIISDEKLYQDYTTNPVIIP
ncbi:MAG: nucleotidyltransferase family protein [Tissierellia bacterium]|nr:nucleotidyltransferase family protein [Tissierellia bacterium]